MLRHLAAVGLGVGVVCVSSSALAQSESGLALGLRVGYAVPLGKAGAIPPETGGTTNTNNDDLNDTITGMVPLFADVGYRINPALYVGAFFQYGFAFVNDDNSACTQGLSCSAHDIAVGANLHYHILPNAPFDPWVGAGLGYEWLTGSSSGSVALGAQKFTIDGSSTLKGFQFLLLEAGGDFKATPALAVGPFVNFALGKYTTYSSSATLNGMSQDRSGDLADTGLHEWLTLGIRGQYNL